MKQKYRIFNFPDYKSRIKKREREIVIIKLMLQISLILDSTTIDISQALLLSNRGFPSLIAQVALRDIIDKVT